MTQGIKPILLIILDGWGHTDPNDHNAITAANTPVWDTLWKDKPHTLISGSGQDVGLPEGQMGNSEVGHLNIGAGRIVRQEYSRIDQAIQTGTFQNNRVFKNALEKANLENSSVHIMGLLSPGGVHSHENQIHAILDCVALNGIEKLYVHAFLDGRDTPPKSAEGSIEKLEKHLTKIGIGKIASLSGRYYAMDRDKRWERTQQVYNILTTGKAKYYAHSALAGLHDAYERGETDEFVKPTLIHENLEEPISIQDNDVVIFMNFRADRARQLTRAFTEDHFTAFERQRFPKLSAFITLTNYADDIQASVAFPPVRHQNVLAEVLANHGMKQLRIAETEKYAHVTYFFSGGVEDLFPGERRVLVPSPKVATYDLHPEMSAPLLTDRMIEAIESHRYDFIVCNYANPDMVGHTGNFDATVKAIETVDVCLGRLLQTIEKAYGEIVITADHGNAEQMYDNQTKQAHTAHTSEPVPFIYVGRSAKVIKDYGTLADVAPTLLHIMGIEKPDEMTGESLLQVSA